MTAGKPNILLITTDQHRLSGVGAYGPTPCQTPNIDALASKGVLFENTYTTCPVCTPARASIMTGLYPHSHGMTGNPHQLGTCVSELPDHPDILPRRLATGGYQLGWTGKWHLGTGYQTIRRPGSYIDMPNTPSLPERFGFQGHRQDPNGKGHSAPGFAEYLQVNRLPSGTRPPASDSRRPAHNYGILEGPEEATFSYYLVNETIKLIDDFKTGDEPFFISHNFPGPHHPWKVPQAFYDLYRDVDIPEWPNYRWEAGSTPGPHGMNLHPRAQELEWADWAESIRYYYAYISLIDRQIGRLLEHLEMNGLMENTMIVFTSDHGEAIGSHGGLSNKGWTHFEEIQRVPLIVVPPQGFSSRPAAPERVRSEFASLADLYPTLLDYAGALGDDIPYHGRSLRPLLESRAVKWREAVFVEFFSVFRAIATLYTVRKGSWKYGWNAVGRDELYDLDSDPHEMNNLIDAPAAQPKRDELRQTLAEWARETGVTLSGPDSPTGKLIPGVLE
ncbi:MAG: sulfatase-like hydrolase/transferase [Candidatus Brocadiia bacterium]